MENKKVLIVGSIIIIGMLIVGGLWITKGNTDEIKQTIKIEEGNNVEVEKIEGKEKDEIEQL